MASLGTVEFSLDRNFEFVFFVAFEAVACTGVLASCDGVVVASAGLRLSFDMLGFVEVGFELDFPLRGILQNSNTVVSV